MVHILGGFLVVIDALGRARSRDLAECGAMGGPVLPPARVFRHRAPDATGLCPDCADLVGLEVDS